MAFPILGTPKPQFFGNDKDFLSGGLLYTYDPATDLPKATYPTADDADAATNANTNPIILNSRGEPPTGYWGIDYEAYKISVTSSSGTQIWAIDDVSEDSYYNEGSTGAVDRTINARLRDRVSVKDFGAVGDGSTDDTAAVQAAIDAGGSRADIYFPPANYVINGPVNITSNQVTLSGYGATISGGTGQTAGGGAGQGLFKISGGGFNAHGFDIDMQARIPAFQCNPDGADLVDLRFSDMWINSAFYAIRTSGDATYQCRYVYIDNIRSTATAALNAGHFLHVYTYHIHINNCHTRRGQNASCYGFNSDCRYITVTGCTAEENQDTTTSDASLEIEDCPSAYAVVTGNSFDHDIWVDESSNISIGSNIARRLRFTVTDTDSTEINCNGGLYGSITIDDIGTVVGTPKVDAAFVGITLDPANYSRASTIFLGGPEVGECRFHAINMVSDGSTANLSLTRNASQDVLFENVDFNGGTVTIAGSGGTLKARGCADLVSRNNGTGTILSGTTSIAVTHGLDSELGVPQIGFISVTLGENPTNTPGAIWVDTITATQFTVNCENDPGASNLDFGWTAIREVY